MDTVSGGCLCGKIRFEVPAEPMIQVLCHCTDCQTVSGSAFYTAYLVPLDQLKAVSGEPGRFEVIAQSGHVNARCFCWDCGSRVWAELEGGRASVNGMALDDRSHFKPDANHRLETAPAWCAINEELQHIPGQPPPQ